MNTNSSLLEPVPAAQTTMSKVIAAEPSRGPNPNQTAFGCPRDFGDNHFVYLVISARARGMSIGINLNPDKYCNFDCAYCEVDRSTPPRDFQLDTDRMVQELESTLDLVYSGKLRERQIYASVPAELLRLRHVALSGDGEPTLCPNFLEAVQGVIHVRARSKHPPFKVVLITNATGLLQPQVQEGLAYMTRQDEIWAKLDAGTQEFMSKVNHPQASLTQVLSNILTVARQRPVIIQSLFARINGVEPSTQEIEEYSHRLLELKMAGANIPMVHLYSASRPTKHSTCSHLPLRSLARIAQSVRQIAGLRVEVF